MKIKHNYYLLPCVDAAKVRECAINNANKGEPSIVHHHEEDDPCVKPDLNCEVYGV